VCDVHNALVDVYVSASVFGRPLVDHSAVTSVVGCALDSDHCSEKGDRRGTCTVATHSTLSINKANMGDTCLFKHTALAVFKLMYIQT